MILNDRAAELSMRINQLAEAKAGAQNVSKLTTRCTQVAEDVLLIKRNTASVVALNAVGINVNVSSSFLLRLTQEFESLAREQISNSSFITSSDGEMKYREQRRYLKDLAEQLSVSCRQLWAQYTSESKPIVDLELLKILEIITSFSETVQKIRLEAAQLTLMEKSVPSSAEEAARFRSLCASIRELWESIVGTGLPSDVEEFLRALGRGSVPLPLLSETVMLWIVEKGLCDKLYVTTR